jgi:hypothetical protein
MGNRFQKGFIFFSFLFVILPGILIGCGATASRPPSVAAFMADSDRGQGTNFFANYSYHFGDLQNSERISFDGDGFYPTFKKDEWNAMISSGVWFPISYVRIGSSLQGGAPVFHVGGTFPYGGAFVWFPLLVKNDSTVRNDLNSRGYNVPTYVFQGGIRFIQQWPFSSDLRVGIAEHISRNAYERYYQDYCLGYGGTCSYPVAEGYTEWGLGAYVTSYLLGKVAFSLEFRYGNEWDSSNQRFALEFVLNVLPHRKKQ